MATMGEGKGEESPAPHQRYHGAMTKTADGFGGERDSQIKWEGEETTTMLCFD